MLNSASLAVLTALIHSLENSTEHGLKVFLNECNQIHDVYYLKCQEDGINGTQLNVYINHLKKEGRLDEFLQRLWISYLCKSTGCIYNLESIRFSAKSIFDLLLGPSPAKSRALLPLFPYRTVRYSIYVRKPDKRVRLFAFYYIFSPTLWIVVIGSLGLITMVTLLIRKMLASFNPLQEALQSLYNLFANNGSTDGFYGSNSSRIVYIVGSTLILIFWISFSTFLIAELAVSPPSQVHGDVRQLLQGSLLKAICVEPNSAVHARLLSTVRPLVNVDPCPIGWPQWVNLLGQVCNSKASRVAFVESSSFIQEYEFFHQRRPTCKLSTIMDNVFQIPKAILVRRGYPYREEVGKIFLKLTERGIAQLVTRLVFEAFRSEKQEEIIQEGYLRISLRRLAITFALIGIGVGLAGVIFVLEWVAYFRMND